MRGTRIALTLLALASLVGMSAEVQAERVRAGLAEGELPFRICSFSFPADGDSSRLLVIATLRADLLHWENVDSLRASLDINWQLHSGGRRHRENSQHLDFAHSPDMPRIEGQILASQEWVVAPGHYRMEFSGEDPGRHTGSILGLFGHSPQGRWSGRLEARDYDEGVVSDILLYTVGADSLSRPNPWASFIEGDPFLELFSVLRPPESGEGWFSLELDLLDSQGESIMQRRGGWKLGAEPYPLRLRLPLAGLDAGDYNIALKTGGPGLETEPVYADFQILPRAKSSDAQRLFERVQAHLLFTGNDFREWESQPPALRNEVLRREWENRDPDIREPGNPPREEFIRRYRRALRQYGGFRPGPLTDRGRMVILLGEPDEIIVDVLPENKESLIDAVKELHGIAEGGVPDASLERDLGRVGLGGPGSPGVESEAFEMWTYRLGGDPLLPETRLGLREVDLKLIFVDRSGTGEYSLEFSSEKFDF